MTNNDYIWTFNEEALGRGIDGSFSLEYHIPRSRLKADPALLLGARLWLVVKIGEEHFLYAVLTPTTLERYQEGKYRDDYLLCSEGFLSVRFLPRHDSREPWKLLAFENYDGIRECVDAERYRLEELLEKNRRVSFAPPSRAVMESVPRTVCDDLDRAVPDQFISVLRTAAFGDVSRTQSFPESLSALGCIAFAILKATHPEFPEAEMVSLIGALDLMATAAPTWQGARKEILTALSSLPPVVDTFLEEIDPERISPRTFVAAAPYSSEWLDKTNDAEQAHERILKDFVLRLRGKGFRVYKSRSVDLVAEKSGARFLWEIKSANALNATAQGEKGIVQLLRYSTALSENGVSYVKVLLLLQDSDQPAIQRYLARMAARAGIDLWLYNDRREWPQRVYNLKAGTIPNL